MDGEDLWKISEFMTLGTNVSANREIEMMMSQLLKVDASIMRRLSLLWRSRGLYFHENEKLERIVV